MIILNMTSKLNSRKNIEVSRRAHVTMSLMLCVSFLVFSSNSTEAHRMQHAEVSQPAIDNSPVEFEQLAREYSLIGSDRLLERGREYLEPSLKLANPTATTLFEAAWLNQAEHEFALAQEYLNKVLELRPNDPRAWLLKASVHTVQGQKVEAKAACQNLVRTLSAVAALACSARLADTPEQIRKSFDSLEKLGQLKIAQELKPWLDSVTADLAAELGYLTRAEAYYRSSIEGFASVQVRAAYADLLLRSDRYEDVLSLINPNEEAPALRVRSLLAQKQLGQNVHDNVHQLDSLLRSWIEQGDYRHAREMAMFYIHVELDAPLAHELAIKNYQTQKETEDLNLLAETKLLLTTMVSGN